MKTTLIAVALLLAPASAFAQSGGAAAGSALALAASDTARPLLIRHARYAQPAASPAVAQASAIAFSAPSVRNHSTSPSTRNAA